MLLQVALNGMEFVCGSRAKPSILIDIHDTRFFEMNNHIRLMVAIHIDKAERHRYQIRSRTIQLRPEVDTRLRAIAPWQFDDLDATMEIDDDKMTGRARRFVVAHIDIDLEGAGWPNWISPSVVVTQLTTTVITATRASMAYHPDQEVQQQTSTQYTSALHTHPRHTRRFWWIPGWCTGRTQCSRGTARSGCIAIICSRLPCTLLVFFCAPGAQTRSALDNRSDTSRCGVNLDVMVA